MGWELLTGAWSASLDFNSLHQGQDGAAGPSEKVSLVASELGDQQKDSGWGGAVN